MLEGCHESVILLAATGLLRTRDGFCSQPSCTRSQLPDGLYRDADLPSQGTVPVSTFVSFCAVPYCYWSGQQDSWGYSLAKEGWPHIKKNSSKAPLASADGVCSRELFR